ncbi:PP2C family protein-serine/threonine phosphatase [Goodfellowiella coeruleoviolacea]|uniref:Serine/threonine protein phosphatase PstP n=1 Tax=Goodfellowiella coeruleoviolacea TaxID=334858 RepID=A0AAE3GK11_9PSEU|nr:PP2C family serine/threonine-protein phosphatase [Goodfellowiella coeruleoviolacea]MCP2168993.1 protein phosphatase [Goodfellowiella coeruleoviolacea]
MTLVLRYAARSDRGLVRSNNQDSVYAGPRLLALADGMGGHAAGEVASKVVIAALAHLDDDEPGDDLLGQLREAVFSGNSAISELVASDPELDGMGTTLTAVLFAGSRLGLVHIGDSRAYLLRNGTFAQITHDDTFVQSLIDEGRITQEEAENHPQRSLLLRALTGHEVEPSLAVREARSGDRYLLCSDGLSGVVSLETLSEAIQIPDPQACADRMIELALRGGGPDNVTCIVADVVDVDYGEDAPIVGGAAGDGSEEQPPPDSAAARAGAITAPPRPPVQRFETPVDPPDPGRKRRRRLRTLLLLVLVLALAGGALFAVRYWVMRQYFVGANEERQVVIFQGVTGSILGVSLHTQVEGSCPAGEQNCEPIYLDDLQGAARETVRTGITDVDGLAGARAAIAELRTERLLPPCITEPQSEQPVSGQPSGDQQSSSVQPTSSAGVPSSSVSSAPNSAGFSIPSGSVVTDSSAQSSPSQELTSVSRPSQSPGVNCRKDR